MLGIFFINILFYIIPQKLLHVRQNRSNGLCSLIRPRGLPQSGRACVNGRQADLRLRGTRQQNGEGSSARQQPAPNTCALLTCA